MNALKDLIDSDTVGELEKLTQILNTDLSGIPYDTSAMKYISSSALEPYMTKGKAAQ
jgi:hypothetical protein